jgi:hypothetical protein
MVERLDFARPSWTPFGKSRPGMETFDRSTCADQQTTVVEGGSGTASFAGNLPPWWSCVILWYNSMP